MNKYQQRFLKQLVLCFIVLSASANVLSKEHVVGMSGWEFSPANLTIMVGDTVVWINDDDTRHKLSFEDKLSGGPTRDDAHKFNVGDKFHFKFTKAGKYKYTCITHEGQDMVGLVIVKDKK